MIKTDYALISSTPVWIFIRAAPPFLFEVVVKNLIIDRTWELALPFCLIHENDNSSVYMNEVLVHGRHETEWVTISKDEYDSMNRTIDVLADKNLIVQIKKSKAENVKSRDFEDLAQELGI